MSTQRPVSPMTTSFGMYAPPENVFVMHGCHPPTKDIAGRAPPAGSASTTTGRQTGPLPFPAALHRARLRAAYTHKI